MPSRITLCFWSLCLVSIFRGDIAWFVYKKSELMLMRHATAWNHEKFTKNAYFWHSRSSMLVPLESWSAVLVMISSKCVCICNRSHARWANSGKITISYWGAPLWCPRSRRIPSPSGTKLPRQKVETLDYHTVKIRSVYLTWAWIGTGSWQTDGQTNSHW